MLLFIKRRSLWAGYRIRTCDEQLGRLTLYHWVTSALFGCGRGIWTPDLLVMSQTSHRTAPPRVKLFWRTYPMRTFRSLDLYGYIHQIRLFWRTLNYLNSVARAASAISWLFRLEPIIFIPLVLWMTGISIHQNSLLLFILFKQFRRTHYYSLYASVAPWLLKVVYSSKLFNVAIAILST